MNHRKPQLFRPGDAVAWHDCKLNRRVTGTISERAYTNGTIRVRPDHDLRRTFVIRMSELEKMEVKA